MENVNESLYCPKVHPGAPLDVGQGHAGTTGTGGLRFGGGAGAGTLRPSSLRCPPPVRFGASPVKEQSAGGQSARGGAQPPTGPEQVRSGAGNNARVGTRGPMGGINGPVGTSVPTNVVGGVGSQLRGRSPYGVFLGKESSPASIPNGSVRDGGGG